MTHYMQGQYLATDGPYYLVRPFGNGENIVRCGDLLTAIREQRFVHPHGPCWLPQAKLDALTKADRKALKALGVKELKAIPVTEVRSPRS